MNFLWGKCVLRTFRVLYIPDSYSVLSVDQQTSFRSCQNGNCRSGRDFSVAMEVTQEPDQVVVLFCSFQDSIWPPKLGFAHQGFICSALLWHTFMSMLNLAEQSCLSSPGRSCVRWSPSPDSTVVHILRGLYLSLIWRVCGKREEIKHLYLQCQVALLTSLSILLQRMIFNEVIIRIFICFNY